MNISNPSMAQQIAEAASAFQQERTGRAPRARALGEKLRRPSSRDVEQRRFSAESRRRAFCPCYLNLRTSSSANRVS